MQFKSSFLTLLTLIAATLISGEINAQFAVSPDGVLTIGPDTDSVASYAFARNNDLREVRFAARPDNRPLRIGDYAFMDCPGLDSLSLPDFVVSLGEGCFRDCRNLTALRLPRTLRSTPRYMAAWCVNLREVLFPENLKKIGAHSFAYCESLAAVDLPARLENIENNAFSRALSLTDVRIPDSVTALESYAFSDCLSLKRCVLPANPALLGELIFSGCEALTELVEPSPVPPPFDCNSFIFEPEDRAAYSRCRLNIDPAKLDLYMTAPGWSLFFTE